MSNNLVSAFITARGKELGATIPLSAYEASAGYDLAAVEQVVIKPGETGTVDTEIGFVIPQGYVGLVFQRSGMGRGHLLLRGSGVIDSDYQGTVKLWFRNLKSPFWTYLMTHFGNQKDNGDITIEPGDRVAQILFVPHLFGKLIEIKETDLTPTVRGKGHSGSSGR